MFPFIGIGVVVAVLAQPGREVGNDPKQLAERIIDAARTAGARLADRDPGIRTQQLQREVLTNLDKMIDALAEPPRPKQDSSSGKSGGGSSSAASRKQRRDRAAGERIPAPRFEPGTGTQPLPGAGMGEIRKDSPAALMPQLPDVYKNVWGHLPEKARQEMDQYFREQFMPRYSDLLKQYYSSLAENAGKKR